ncbi:FeoB-associated Cys-rich membrane protein [Candidatus Electronema sp. PJ]|uniref:FeoB-associated Cys-rich membrane protein n=1 Tax=Candidatus Electronema sp. PJ TaxID=3401572 RepID=UPI003AA8F271
MQDLLVGLIVLGILVWLAFRLFRAFRSGFSSQCRGGCSSCGKTNCPPPEEEADKQR